MNADREFEREVLSGLAEIKADLRNACEDLKENRSTHKELFRRLNEHDQQITEIKVRAGLWGAISGAATSTGAAIAIWLRGS